MASHPNITSEYGVNNLIDLMSRLVEQSQKSPKESIPNLKEREVLDYEGNIIIL